MGCRPDRQNPAAARHRVFDFVPRMQATDNTAAAFQRLQPALAIAPQPQPMRAACNWPSGVSK